jgi:hypothetical protein
MLLKMSLWYFVQVIASIAVVIPIIVGITTVKKSRDNTFLIVLIYCLIYAIFEMVAWYYVKHHLQNHFLLNTTSYIDIGCWGTYFYLILEKPYNKKIVIFLSISTTLLTLWSHLGTGRDYNRLDSFALSIGSLSLISMSLLFFYQLLNNLNIKNIFTYPHFWINVGVLLYFSGSFFTFTFAEYIAFSKDSSIIQFIGISGILLFFHRIFLAIGLWFSKTPIQSNLSSK